MWRYKILTVLESLIKAKRIETLLSNQLSISLQNMIKDGFKKEHELNKRVKEACELSYKESHIERLSQ